MTAQELIAKVLEQHPAYVADEGLSLAAYKRLLDDANAAPVLARLLQKAIEQRNYFMTQSGFRDGKGFEMRKLRENAELDRIAKGEE